MLSIVLALALTSASEQKTAEPLPEVTAATRWVKLIDAARWEDSWDAAGALFKSRITSPHWASTIEGVREPFGAVSSRSLTDITKASSLPGAPDGQYEILKFQTSFAHKKDAIETVVLAHEASGWKVDGYFIH
jgi:hypothetical protein